MAKPPQATVHRLSLETFANRQIGCFSLPRIVGHYSTYDRLVAARSADIARRATDADPDKRTTADDYIIEAFPLDAD